MKAHSRLLYVCAGALAAGIINGLLGAGGGIIMIFVLAPALGGLYENGEDFYKRRDLMAISLSVMLDKKSSLIASAEYGSPKTSSLTESIIPLTELYINPVIEITYDIIKAMILLIIYSLPFSFQYKFIRGYLRK